jgi:hypothetical protein
MLNGTAEAVPLISTVKAAAFGDASEGARDFDFLPLFAVLTARFLREVLNGTAFDVPLILTVKAAALLMSRFYFGGSSRCVRGCF